MLSAFRP